MATKWVPRERIRASIPELAIIFRGESVSGHPGAREAKQIPNIAWISFQNIEYFRCDFCDCLGLPGPQGGRKRILREK